MIWKSGNFRHDGYETSETMKEALADSLRSTHLLAFSLKFSLEIDVQRLSILVYVRPATRTSLFNLVKGRVILLVFD